MSGAQDTTLIVLTGVSVDVRVASALQSAAEALGYADGCAIVRLSDVDDLRHFVFESDPWTVMAIDDASINALREAFDLDARDFAGDVPATILSPYPHLPIALTIWRPSATPGCA